MSGMHVSIVISAICLYINEEYSVVLNVVY